MSKGIQDMTIEELRQIKPLNEYEAEALEKLNIKIGDCIVVSDIRNHLELAIVEDLPKNGIVNILAPYGHSLTGVLSIKENYGNIGNTHKELREKFPQYYI